jgi:hypothetical protein
VFATQHVQSSSRFRTVSWRNIETLCLVYDGGMLRLLLTIEDLRWSLLGCLSQSFAGAEGSSFVQTLGWLDGA